MGHLPGPCPLLTNATSPCVCAPPSKLLGLLFLQGWNLQFTLRNRVRTSPAAAAHTATCQKTRSRREHLRQEEFGRGTKNKVCVLSRAASPLTVVFLETCLQFQEHAIFSCGGLAHKVHVQKEIARHRQRSNPNVFCVNKEQRKKSVCPSVLPPNTHTLH